MRIPSVHLLLSLFLVSGCVSEEVRRVDMTPPDRFDQPLPEEQLLDVGVSVFDPNVPEEYDKQIALLIQPEIRRAEANYIPYFAKDLLQSTGNWGAVRVIPRPTHAVDVVVSGRILHSTGESQKLEITVTDATGKTWFTREYQSLASKYAYDDTIPASIDPFQSIYKELSDDMLEYRRKLTAEDVRTIRATAKMKFAQSFAPDAFADHIAESEKGDFQLKRLPAPDDPMLQRVERVREREYLFIDTLDEYYENYHRNMYSSYQNWREATYEEAIARKELVRARNQAITGAAVSAIAGGVTAVASDNSAVDSTAIFVGAAGAAMLGKRAFAKQQEAEIHAEAIREVGVAAEAEVMPHTIELENQVVRLEGTVDEQYDRLRGILRDLYFADLDLPVPGGSGVDAEQEEPSAEADLEAAMDTDLAQ